MAIHDKSENERAGRDSAVTAYEELRTAFTAAVSHELRTPVARLLALLDSALRPGADARAYVEQARAEVEEISELIDDVLFLGELETGREVVSLGSTPALPVLERVRETYADSARRADVTLSVVADPEVELPLRPRMLALVAENLAENAVRYAGPRASFVLEARRRGGAVELVASDDGAGVAEHELDRLFERFYRGDRARSSRGTGLGLAIVKHVVVSAGGEVEVAGGPGRGLRVGCRFSDP